jgi:hypothetical protein
MDGYFLGAFLLLGVSAGANTQRIRAFLAPNIARLKRAKEREEVLSPVITRQGLIFAKHSDQTGYVPQ